MGWRMKGYMGLKKKKEQYKLMLTSLLAIRYVPNFLHKPARKKAEGSEGSKSSFNQVQMNGVPQ
jgi:hypothetical protein